MATYPGRFRSKDAIPLYSSYQTAARSGCDREDAP